MSRVKKLITALLLMIFCVSVFTVTAMAVGEDGSSLDVSGGDSEVVVPTEAPPVYEDPTTPEVPDVTEPYVPVEPTTVYYEPATEAPTYYEEPVTDAPIYNDYDSDYDDYYETPQSSYVGGGQVYVEPESTAPTAALYNSSSKIDDTELSNNDWKEISANLANASNAGDDDGDFGYIQNNNNAGDNGHLILIMGVMCILLGVAGIIYLIASSVSRRKKIPAGNAGGRQYATAGGSRNRASDDYDDGYRTSAKSEKKKLDRSRKYDTADVKLPKSGSRYKNGGRRYK